MSPLANEAPVRADQRAHPHGGHVRHGSAELHRPEPGHRQLLHALIRSTEGGVVGRDEQHLRTLAALGVPAEPEVVLGEPGAVLGSRIAAAHDLVVLGAPPPDAEGRCSWSRSMRFLLDGGDSAPVLVVRAARGQGLEPAGDVE